MKTTLINCGVKINKEYDGGRVPQGCLYLLAAAEKYGHHVDFRDYQTVKLADPLDSNAFVSFMEDDSDVVAISCMSNLLPLVVYATQIFKERYPNKTILLGGIGPSGVAEALMTAFPHIDIIAKGEGDETFPELLSAIEEGRRLETVAGIVVRTEDGGFQVTEPRRRIRRLDDLPLPAYNRLNMSCYETVGIQTARGCPFPCAFCDVSAYWGRTTKYRSIPSVMDELEILEAYGFDKVTILDDTFILMSERVDEFCNAWLDRERSIEWSAYCRVDLLNDRMIDIFADSGCYRVFLGVESGSTRTLRQISKPFDLDHLVYVVRKMAKQFIVRTSLIWGFPFETLEDLAETVHLLFYLQDLGCDASLALLSPLPLSRLYQEGKYELILRDDLQSSVVSSRFFLPDGSGLLNGKPTHQVDLIRQYPNIFPGFYTFRDNWFEKKLEYLHSMGLAIEKLERP